MQVRSLTVLQNWDCHSCADCCRSYRVPVSADEKQKIEAQGWASRPEFQGAALFVRESGEDYLAHKPDGSCVFLGPDNKCRIHAEHGAAAKPLACRIYPFVLVPAGDHWNLGLRLACPSATENKGRPLADHVGAAREFASVLEKGNAKGAFGAAPPPIHGRQVLPWNDIARIAAVVSKVLAAREDPFERRWRKVLFLVSMLRKAKFDGGGDAKKAVTGGRLSELLHVLSLAAEDEEPKTAAEVPAPGWVGRMVFRQLTAVYARKDHGAERGPALRGPLSRFWSAVKFAWGRGPIPRVHAALPPGATFAAGTVPLTGVSDVALSLLERWHRVKVESLLFCGSVNFGLGVWEGLESLAATYPVALWLARVLVAGGTAPDAAVVRAVRITDDNFGYNPLLGSMRQKMGLGLLASRGELRKLIAYYSVVVSG